MDEIIPVLCGAISGILLGSMTARRPTLVWVVSSVVLGIAATVVTGEWRISWAFVLIDIPLVAITSLVAYVASRRMTLRLLDAGDQT